MSGMLASVSMALAGVIGPLDARSGIKFMSDDKVERKLARRKKRQSALKENIAGANTDNKNSRHFGGPPEGPLRATATAPVEISFEVPFDLKPSATQVCVVGPHGALKIDLPRDARPGQELKVRLGPAETYSVTVPEDLADDALVTLKLPSGLLYQVKVPSDKKPGDEFEIIPPVMMVQVPDKAVPGMKVIYTDSRGDDQVALIPDGVKPGEYFEMPL